MNRLNYNRDLCIQCDLNTDRSYFPGNPTLKTHLNFFSFIRSGFLRKLNFCTIFSRLFSATLTHFFYNSFAQFFQNFFRKFYPQFFLQFLQNFQQLFSTVYATILSIIIFPQFLHHFLRNLLLCFPFWSLLLSAFFCVFYGSCLYLTSKLMKTG